MILWKGVDGMSDGLHSGHLAQRLHDYASLLAFQGYLSTALNYLAPVTSDDVSHFTSTKEVMFLPFFVCLFVCLSVCQQHNSKSYGRIFLKFWEYVRHGINYQWFNFGGDPAGILDSGSLSNFRYHCVKGGIRISLAKWIWWRHLVNNIALAKVPVGYDCFLVLVEITLVQAISPVAGHVAVSRSVVCLFVCLLSVTCMYLNCLMDFDAIWRVHLWS